jgi:hypothetical protein
MLSNVIAFGQGKEMRGRVVFDKAAHNAFERKSMQQPRNAISTTIPVRRVTYNPTLWPGGLA